MFTLEIPEQPHALNEVIEQLINHLSTTPEGTEEYAACVDQLNKLYKAKEIDLNLKLKELELLGKQNDLEIVHKQKEKELLINQALKENELVLRQQEIDANCRLKDVEASYKEKESEDFRRVKPETLALIAANIAGIVLVIGHERINVITSKALGFIGKLR